MKILAIILGMLVFADQAMALAISNREIEMRRIRGLVQKQDYLKRAVRTVRLEINRIQFPVPEFPVPEWAKTLTIEEHVETEMEVRWPYILVSIAAIASITVVALFVAASAWWHLVIWGMIAAIIILVSFKPLGSKKITNYTTGIDPKQIEALRAAERAYSANLKSIEDLKNQLIEKISLEVVKFDFSFDDFNKQIRKGA